MAQADLVAVEERWLMTRRDQASTVAGCLGHSLAHTTTRIIIKKKAYTDDIENKDFILSSTIKLYFRCVTFYRLCKRRNYIDYPSL